MLTVALGALGCAVSLLLARAARRSTVVDRARTLRARPSRIPARLMHPTERALAAMGIEVDPAVALQCWLLAAVLVGALGALFSPAIAALGVLAVIAAAPIGVHLAREREARRAVAAVPDALERCALELRSGGTVITAIEALADQRGPLARDFARVRQRCALGATFGDAVAQWPIERDAPGVRAASGAFALAVSVGGAGADAFDGLAASLRARVAVAAEARSLSAQARLSAIVVGASPVAYLAWSAVVDPAPVHALVGSGAGRACLVAAVALEAVAVWWIRRILREEVSWS